VSTQVVNILRLALYPFPVHHIQSNSSNLPFVFVLCVRSDTILLTDTAQQEFQHLSLYISPSQETAFDLRKTPFLAQDLLFGLKISTTMRIYILEKKNPQTEMTLFVFVQYYMAVCCLKISQ